MNLPSASSRDQGHFPGGEHKTVPGSAPHVPLCRYRGEVKHIKVMTAEGLYRVTEKKAFKGLVVSIGAPFSAKPPCPRSLGPHHIEFGGWW